MTDHSVDDRAESLSEPAEGSSAAGSGGPASEGTAGLIAAPLVRFSGVVGSALAHLGVHLEQHDHVHPDERRRVIFALFHEGPRIRPFFARYLSLMALAVTIAALGLISDSTAVVIGAMLVAPLMGPALAVAAAVVMAWPLRVIRQSFLVFVGSVLSIGLAALIAFAVPGDPIPLPGELVARTSPNLLDLGIALAAGAAGAYGQVRKQASDALPGVAVAVALVPPLATVGIMLQMTEWQMALGAMMLYLVNVTGIVISASLTFIACGFVPGRRLLTGNSSIASGLRWVALAVIIVVLPLQFGRGHVLPPTDQTADIVAAVEEFVDSDNSAAEVVDVSVDVAGEVTDVNVVLVASAKRTPPVTALASYLSDRLDTSVDVRMQVVTTQTDRATSSKTPEVNQPSYRYLSEPLG